MQFKVFIDFPEFIVLFFAIDGYFKGPLESIHLQGFKVFIITIYSSSKILQHEKKTLSELNQITDGKWLTFVLFFPPEKSWKIIPTL